jgi:phosphoribosylformylglycinamidine synthase
LGIVGNEVPDVNLDELPRVVDTVHTGIVEGQIKAAHDISEGGLVTAVAEMCFGGGVGVDLEIDSEMRPDLFIFNETAGTFVVEVENEEVARELFGEVPHAVIGRTKAGTDMTVKHFGRELFTADINELKEAWQSGPVKQIIH